MLFIHIGTLKTGSTAIQAFMKAHSDALALQGIHYPEAGRRDRHKHYYLRDEIRVTSGAGGQEWAAVNALRAAHPADKVLVSEEGFALMKPDDVVAMRRLAGDAPVTVVAYYRDYASWLPSMYAEYTKNGRNLLDFDAYFEALMAQPSQGEVIEYWARAFGWDKLCVRLFGRDSLVNGDVVDDLLQILGTSRSALNLPEDEPVRAAPGWESLETARAVLSRIAALPGGTVDGRLPLFVRGACKDATAAVAPTGARADYLSAEQRRRCDALTRRDIDTLNAHLPLATLVLPPPKPINERSFLPSVAQVPVEWVVDAMARMAVLIAAQVPDGRVERKTKRKKGAAESPESPAGTGERGRKSTPSSSEVASPASSARKAKSAKKSRKARPGGPSDPGGAAAAVPAPAVDKAERKRAKAERRGTPGEDRATRKARKAAARATPKAGSEAP